MITLIGMRAASLKGTLKSKYIMYGLLASMSRMDGTTGLEVLRCSSVIGRSLTCLGFGFGLGFGSGFGLGLGLGFGLGLGLDPRSLTLASVMQTASAMAAAKKVPCICTWNWMSSGAMK